MKNPNQRWCGFQAFTSSLFLLVVMFLFVSVSQAEAATSRDRFSVKPLRIDPKANSSETTLRNGTIWLRTIINRDRSSILQLRLRGGKSFIARYFPNGVIQRFWVAGVADHQRMILVREQKYVKQILDRQRVELQNQHPAAFAFLQFIADFLPPNEIIEPFEDSSFAAPLKPNLWELRWIMICDFVGKKSQAVFTVGGDTVSVTAPVGLTKSGCRGRCGTQCEQWGQYRANQYTQECFDHDVCRDNTGTNLGECSDEFWAAAPGYTWAENCF